MLELETGSSSVISLAFEPSGRLYFGNSDGALSLSDGFTIVPIDDAKRTEKTVTRAIHAHAPSGRTFFGGTYGLSELVTNAEGLFESQIKQETWAVTSLVTLNAKTMVVGTGLSPHAANGTLMLVDVDTLRMREPSFREKDGITALTVHAATNTVAWATGGRQFATRNVIKPDAVRVSLDHTTPSISFHPSGQVLAFVQDWSLRCYDLNRRQLREPIKGHKGKVTAVAFHPFDATLYSTSWDGTVRAWDVQSGKETQCWAWNAGRILCLALHPDGTQAAIGTDQGKLFLWDLS